MRSIAIGRIVSICVLCHRYHLHQSERFFVVALCDSPFDSVFFVLRLRPVRVDKKEENEPFFTPCIRAQSSIRKMSRSAYLLCVLFLACSCLIYSASGARNYRRGYKTTEPPTTTPPPQTPKEFLDSRPGISTFGIIAIIFTVIVLCLIFYYGIICYPLLCRDEKKYRFMDVSSTITAATSRSIQSIENYPDQKHHHQLA